MTEQIAELSEEALELKKMTDEIIELAEIEFEPVAAGYASQMDPNG